MNATVGKSVLHEIGNASRIRVEKEKSLTPLASLKDRDPGRRPLDFRKIFDSKGLNIIAEVKRASPSKGDIFIEADPLKVADEYISNGAKAISVLTEPDYFKGDISFLKSIREAHQSFPLLMKDFFVDEYQLYQALHSGADAILIIMALLGEMESEKMLRGAILLGLTPLVEVHDEEELGAALNIGASLIGINNRNLKSLEVSLNTTMDLLPKIPSGITVISESGLETQNELLNLRKAGCHGFLIGSSFMKSRTPGTALRRILDIKEGSWRP
ncbi:MAG: indole-3-glycerol phosphate synthase TrpC [Oligoflexales bacterium]|nr:indole-3-glycerol phosphate synthase TrpC [Oligoflexales bacterium]